jgi:hypothetical protein
MRNRRTDGVATNLWSKDRIAAREARQGCLPCTSRAPILQGVTDDHGPRLIKTVEQEHFIKDQNRS